MTDKIKIAACALMALALAGPAGADALDDVPELKIVTYPVSGTDAASLRRSILSQRRIDTKTGQAFDAFTHWQVSWSWSGDGHGRCDSDRGHLHCPCHDACSACDTGQFLFNADQGRLLTQKSLFQADGCGAVRALCGCGSSPGRAGQIDFVLLRR